MEHVREKLGGRVMAAPCRDRRAHAHGTKVPGKLRAILRDGGILGEKLGVPGKERDAMYAVAYAAYAKRQYERARQLFAQLALYDHQDPRYMKGLAATTQMLGNYGQALQMYVVIAAMDLTDPVPVMHAGDCFNAMGRQAEALESFHLARSLCKGAEHRQVKQRCEQLLGSSKQFAG